MKLKVKSNATHVFRCCGVNILPGVNFISSDNFLAHPAVKARIEAKMLEVTPVEEELTKDFSMMNAKSLIKEVRQILDIKMLNEIKKTENRASVLEVLEAQINKIKD